MYVYFFCGVSTAGKDSLIDNAKVIKVPSCGTRPLRPQETQKDFISVSEDELKNIRESGDALNFADIFDIKYSFTYSEFKIATDKANNGSSFNYGDVGFGVLPKAIRKLFENIKNKSKISEEDIHPIIVYLKMPSDPSEIIEARINTRGDTNQSEINKRIERAVEDAKSFEETLFDGDDPLSNDYDIITIDASQPEKKVLNELKHRVATLSLTNKALNVKTKNTTRISK